MNYVYVRTLLSSVLQRFSILLQSLQNQILICLLLKTKGKQTDLLVVNEGLYEVVCPFPFLLVGGLQNDSLFWVGDEYLVFEVAFLHGFEECDVADGCWEGTDVEFFLILHGVSSIHTRYQYNNYTHNHQQIKIITTYPSIDTAKQDCRDHNHRRGRNFR